MKADNWVPIHKAVKQEFKYINRPYSRIEALLSYTIDIDCGCNWSINGYAKLWKWSRDKVRKFVRDLSTDEGHTLDKQSTLFRHPIHLVTLDSSAMIDTRSTQDRQTSDTRPDTTKKIKIKTNKLPSAKQDFAGEKSSDFYRTKKGKKLSGQKLVDFESFWAAFDDKRGKQENKLS